MREIKFRAWDNGEMLNDVIPTNYGEIITVHPMINDLKLRKVDAIMQYTGLKDKNGKEIYEGDIVEKNEGEYSREVIEYGGEQTDYESGGYAYGIFLEWSIDSYIVIGNIYENPELLTSSDKSV